MIFLDSGFLYAYINTEDSAHSKVKPLMQEILEGKFGSIYISNFIYDEVLTLARFRTKKCEVEEKIKFFVKKEKGNRKIIQLIVIKESFMTKADNLFVEYCKEGLSFTDCSILASMREKKIEYLATLAKEFKGKVKMIGVNE